MRFSKCSSLLCFLGAGLTAQETPFPPPLKPGQVPLRTEEGYRVPQPQPQFVFPRDHGNHPEYAIEWWYITGHLFQEGSPERRFGFQSTFFRNAKAPQRATDATAQFGDREIFMAHKAIFDVRSQNYLYEERLHRDGWNAYASEAGIDLRNGNWTLRAEDYGPSGDPTIMHLEGTIEGRAGYSLRLKPAKAHVLFGDAGLSRKGAAPTASSYYITFTRLEVSGEVRLEKETIPVSGTAWMDHEISSNQLDADQAGWDWASMHLFDGTEVMCYRLRRTDGTSDPYSQFYWIDAGGEVTGIYAQDFEWIAQGDWPSQVTDAVYPIAPLIRATHPETGKVHVYRLRPLGKAQELSGNLSGIPYWEGACEVLDQSGAVIGNAFLELTGYAEPLADRL